MHNSTKTIFRFAVVAVAMALLLGAFMLVGVNAAEDEWVSQLIKLYLFRYNLLSSVKDLNCL